MDIADINVLPVPTIDYGTTDESDTLYTIEEAIDAVGFGKFQWVLLFSSGFIWAADAMEIMVVSFLLPVLAKEWNLVGFWEGSIGSAIFLGIFIGTFFWGSLSDRMGRRKGFLAVLLCCSILGIASTFAPEFWSMLILRALVGFGIGGSPVSFSLFSEFLPTASRGRFLVIFEMFWVVGTLAEAALAWAILPLISWRWLLFISALPFLLLLGVFPWIPESPRLLLTQGKQTEAQQILERVAEWNKTSLPPGRLGLGTNATFVPTKANILDLFAPNLRYLTIVLWALWATHSIVYYGLVLFTPGYFEKSLFLSQNGTVAAPSDAPLASPIAASEPATAAPAPVPLINPQVYLLTFITTFGEFPGLILSGLLVETRLGRKWIQTLFLSLSGICLAGLFANPSPWVAIVLLLAGRMFVNGSWAAAWAYTPEAYPTVVRATGLGAANGMSKFASIFSPYIASSLLELNLSVPVAIFTGAALLGAGLSVLLPFDTARRQLADQLDSSATCDEADSHKPTPSIYSRVKLSKDDSGEETPALDETEQSAESYTIGLLDPDLAAASPSGRAVRHRAKLNYQDTKDYSNPDADIVPLDGVEGQNIHLRGPDKV